MQTELAFSEKFMLMVINGSYRSGLHEGQTEAETFWKMGKKENSKWIRSGAPVKLGDIFVSLIDFGLRKSLCFFIVLGSLQSNVQAFSFLRLTSNFKEAFKYYSGWCVCVCKSRFEDIHC